jgi:tetratricopeptide (TPR) repeat protein
MTSLDIDTRSDIYSLGVLLYELLTRTTPFDAKELLSKGLDEMRRTIREVEPLKPSTRLTQDLVAVDGTRLPSKSELTSRNSQLDRASSRRLLQEVRGDLDWIVMKCLEKDRTRRYETANGLATDIVRHLNSEPIAARPQGKWYRFKKFIERNKLAFGAAIAVTAALVLGLAVSMVMYFKAQTENKKAQLAAHRSEQTAQFLKEMLAGAGPSVARGRDGTVLREILGHAGERIDRELRDQPEAQGDLWLTLGKTYSDIGDRRSAVTNFQRAVESYQLAFHAPNTNLALALGLLGMSQAGEGDVKAGKVNSTLAVEMARKCGNPQTLAACLESLARSFHQWFVQEGAQFLPEAATLRRRLGTNTANLIALGDTLRLLAISDGAGELAERESWAREALTLHSQFLDAAHPKVAADWQALSQLLLDGGKFEEGEAACRHVAELFHKIYDDKHPYQPIVLRFLIEALLHRDKGDEAEAIIQKESASPKWHNYYLSVLATVRAKRGEWPLLIEQLSGPAAWKTDQAEVLFDRTLALIESGRRDDCERPCHDLLTNVSGMPPGQMPDVAALAALLVPIQGDDFQRACQIADSALAANTTNSVRGWAGLNKALADFRRGRFTSAIDWSHHTVAGNANEPCQVAAHFVRALATARLQQSENALGVLTRGDELLQQHRRSCDLNPGIRWQDWTVADILQREAVSFIGQPATGEGRKKLIEKFGPTVVVSVAPKQAGHATISFSSTGSRLEFTGKVILHLGWNNWKPLVKPDVEMVQSPQSNYWQVTVPVGAGATQLDCVFHDGHGTWENNLGRDWHFALGTNHVSTAK